VHPARLHWELQLLLVLPTHVLLPPAAADGWCVGASCGQLLLSGLRSHQLLLLLPFCQAHAALVAAAAAPLGC
jgi:hypothetical protein